MTEPLWKPSDTHVQNTRMHEFMIRASKAHGFDCSWAALHKWSISDPDQFWKEMWDLAGIQASAPAEAVSKGSGMLGTKWFPGLTFNFAEHMLRHDDEGIAIEYADERGMRRTITYRDLRAAVASLAKSMRLAGVTRGDRVGGYLPNIPEAVIGMLASASIGAIWSSCSPDFGTNGVFDRFGQIEPRILIATDGYSYNGKPIGILDRVAGIIERIPSIEHAIIVPFLEHSPPTSDLPKATLWSDFVSGTSDISFEQLPFDHPLYIMYSSGTTGIPKCITHGAGGTLLQHTKELALHCDLRRNDTIFYFTTCGWMMWNWLVGSLGIGATIVLYEGSPGHPDADHLWQLAQDLGISVFGTSPKFLTFCEKQGLQPGRKHNLDELRAVLSTGSPLTVENFEWVYRNVKGDLQLSSICGGTDIISCFMLGNPMLPVYPGEIQCLGLGMDVRAFDSEGKPVIGRKGELVCCTPFPSQPTGFWNDDDGEKYRSAYFDHFENTWRHGDYIEITPRGGVIVYGRSDATLNPGGVRIGTAEIYRIVEAMDEVVDSVVVGRETQDADVEICLFLVLRGDLDDALVSSIKKHIAEGATKRHVPRHIRQVSAIPYTISGKKVELAVTNMIHGRPVANRDALANPDALDQYAGIV